MSAACIHIIGIGVAERAELSREAHAALLQAGIVLGSPRQLQTIAHLLVSHANIQQWVLPKLSELGAVLQQCGDQQIAVLASGDPLYYGIGCWFAQHISTTKLCFYPALSSIQIACHKLGLSMQNIEVVSLHGRPLETLRTRLKNHTTLVVLTDHKSTPVALAAECMAAGFEQSTLTVCENLGYQQECIRKFSVQDLLEPLLFAFAALHVTVIDIAGQGNRQAEFPGIADHRFITGAAPGSGMISKREIRLVILSLLQPTNNDVIWDIGAGCGSVAVELAYWNQRVQVYAIEYHSQRLQYLAANQQRFGVVDNMHIIPARAPACLANLPAPNKVFIGGSDGELTALLQYIWPLLPQVGLLVASAVTAASKQQLHAFAQGLSSEQVESVDLTVKRGTWFSDHMVYTNKLPVEIIKYCKSGAII